MGAARCLLGYDLLAAVCEKLARAVMQDLRRDAKRRHGLASVAPLHAGVMVAVQRFRSNLGLYVQRCHRCVLLL